MFPQGPVLSDKAKTAFKAKGLKLPQDWEQPSGNAGKQFVDAFKEEERSAPADTQRIFQPATDNKLHVDSAKQVSLRIERYIDGICAAIATAWQMWMSQSAVSGVMINGPIGALTSGCVQGGSVCGNDVVESFEECDGNSDGACPAACSGHCACPGATPTGLLELHVIDVGQGDAVLMVSSDGFVMLYWSSGNMT